MNEDLEQEISSFDLGPVESENTAANKEFAQCLEDLRNAEGLKMYSDTYTKLYDTYYKLKDDFELKLEEFMHLQEKGFSLDETVKGYTDTISDYEKTIRRQAQEIEDAKALCDAMHQRELAAVEGLDCVRIQLYKVEKELEFRKRKGEDDDAGAASAAKEKERLEKEIAKVTLEVENLKSRLHNSLEYQEELERKNSSADLAITKMEEELEDAQGEKVRTDRLVDHLNLEIASLKEEIEARGKTIAGLNDKLAKCEKLMKKREQQITNLKEKLEECEKELELTTIKMNNLKDKLKTCTKTTEDLSEQLLVATKSIKNKSDENTKLRNEVAKVNKTYQAQIKKNQLLEQSKTTAEKDRDTLRQQIVVLEREIMAGKKQSEIDKRDIESYQRAQDVAQKMMQKIQLEATENLQLLQLQEQRKVTLEHEIDQAFNQINKQRLIIRSMDKEKDRLLEEAIALNEKIDESAEELRQRTQELLDANKLVRQHEIKMRTMAVSLDTARTERNMLHNNYTEALDQIQDLTQKLKMAMYQVEQQKEDATEKERNLRVCEAALAKCNKKCENLKFEAQAGSLKAAELRAEIAGLRQEEARLNKALYDADSGHKKLLKEIEGLVNERDVVGAQLVRRNDELSFLYEKIRILEGTLQRGEKQYEQRIDDIRLLRLEIIRLRKEKNLLAKGIENMTDLRLEVFNLERELSRARLRTRALEEALETPLNVHRWRKLGATDPDKVDLMKKLTLLQRKVLSQGETLAEKEKKLKETENLYHAIKDMLEVQPSPNIQLQLVQTQKALSKRTTKLRCLVAELSMRESQVNEFRTNLEIALGEVMAYKSKYTELKKLQSGSGGGPDSPRSNADKLPLIKCKCGQIQPCRCTQDNCPYSGAGK